MAANRSVHNLNNVANCRFINREIIADDSFINHLEYNIYTLCARIRGAQRSSASVPGPPEALSKQ